MPTPDGGCAGVRPDGYPAEGHEPDRRWPFNRFCAKELIMFGALFGGLLSSLLPLLLNLILSLFFGGVGTTAV